MANRLPKEPEKPKKEPVGGGAHMLSDDASVQPGAREQRRSAARRRTAITGTAGVATGSYGDRYLEALREDWPE